MQVKCFKRGDEYHIANAVNISGDNSNSNNGDSTTNQKYISLEAFVEPSLVREETFQDRNYIVVPVVALVEGVIQGINSEYPELALASVFGSRLAGWNGRPVVMGHPQDSSGEYVSANSPGILQDWAFGQIFESRLDDKKLKVEAWIDVDAAEERGGDFSDTIDRLVANELVEVSVGTFLLLEERQGTFNGKDYKAIWVDITPDHLALLPKGTVGACSVEDGCGAPRVNRSVDIMQKTAKKSTVLASGRGCSCGGGSGSCSCNSIQVPPPPVEGESVDAFSANELAKRVSATFSVNALPADRFNSDVYRAIRKKIGSAYPYSYCVGYTTDYAVYEQFDYQNDSYAYYKIGINVDSDLEVEFTSDPVEVKVVTSIIETKEPQMTTASGTNPTDNTDATATATVVGATATTTSGEPKATETPQNVENNSSGGNSNDAPSNNSTQNSSGEALNNNSAKAPTTLKGYIESAPAEIREVLTESVRIHADTKARLITEILATNRSPFTEDELKSRTLDEVRKMHTLAGVTVRGGEEDNVGGYSDYAGRGAPRNPASHEDNFAPTPPALFEVKKTA